MGIFFSILFRRPQTNAGVVFEVYEVYINTFNHSEEMSVFFVLFRGREVLLLIFATNVIPWLILIEHVAG